MKVMQQTDYWNDPKVVAEFSNLEYPDYWKEFLTTLKDRPKLSLLDLGCGGGRNSELSLSLEFNVYASDAHKEMVEASKAKFLKFGISKELVDERVVVAGFEKLPYEPSKFDVVIANGVLHNTDQTQELINGIKEITRVLKSSGYLCLNIFIFGDAKKGLHKGRQENVFYNDAGLPMVLLPKEKILELLSKFGLLPFEEIHFYNSQISEGERNVMRGVFQKQA